MSYANEVICRCSGIKFVGIFVIKTYNLKFDNVYHKAMVSWNDSKNIIFLLTSKHAFFFENQCVKQQSSVKSIFSYIFTKTSIFNKKNN